MTEKYQPKSKREILQGLQENAGVTSQEIVNFYRRLDGEIEQKRIRTDLSCWENKERFFDMAKRMYVNDGDAKFKDAEIGMHIGGCESPLCGKLEQAYYETLVPSRPDDSAKTTEALVTLEQTLLLGKEREDLKGEPSNYIEKGTNRIFSITKAVDVTDKGIHVPGDESMLVYFTTRRGITVGIQKRHRNEELVNEAIPVPNTRFDSENPRLQKAADTLKIDPQYLHHILRANAPAKKLEK